MTRTPVRPAAAAPVGAVSTLGAALVVALGVTLPVQSVSAADPIKVGVLLGFTGPIESLTPSMAAGAELAFAEINESGLLLDGRTIEPVRADSTCTDAGAATAAAERLVTVDDVVAIMGADCSGVTVAVANNVAVPNGVVMVSPSSTAPSVTDLEDDGYVFRTVPSDARQGAVLADVIRERGVESIAITYTNNDYGKGLADALSGAFEAAGGTIEITAAHEDGKADYSAEVGALAAAGADALVVLGYVDQGGRGILQASIDTDAFDTYFGGDGMVGDSLIEALGEDIEGFVTTVPGAESDNDFASVAEPAGIELGGPYIDTSYDAGALIALAMQKAGSTDRIALRDALMDVANAPGEPIGPGELARGLELLAAGTDIDYVGASGVELDETGETAGSYAEQTVEGGAWQVIGYR